MTKSITEAREAWIKSLRFERWTDWSVARMGWNAAMEYLSAHPSVLVTDGVGQRALSIYYKEMDGEATSLEAMNKALTDFAERLLHGA